MARSRTRTDLALVAQALTYAETHSNYQTAKTFNLQPSTIRRWQLRAMREPNGWPSPEDIHDWQQDHHQNHKNRARRAAQVQAYRNRTYLTRGPLWTDSTGTIRRLRALIAIGWTQADIAPHLGTSPQYVSLLTRGRHPRVHIDTAATVSSIYDRLSMTIPTHRPTWVHERQRRYALTRGWAPPLAYDDHQLDDPTFYVRGVRPKVA